MAKNGNKYHETTEAPVLAGLGTGSVDGPQDPFLAHRHFGAEGLREQAHPQFFDHPAHLLQGGHAGHGQPVLAGGDQGVVEAPLQGLHALGGTEVAAGGDGELVQAALDPVEVALEVGQAPEAGPAHETGAAQAGQVADGVLQCLP